jgi:ABC-2 type transport system ATP-binding protein
MNAIEARRLTKRYGDVIAVDGIDLAVEQGTIAAFLGPNGAGKTTTTRILTTLLRPTAGTARVGGFDVTTDPASVRRAIGVALQEAGLDGMSTGRELLELQARLHGFGGAEARRRAAGMLELVGLIGAGDRRVSTFSGGMKRRLDLASALIHEPRILFLDEPTEGLDPASRQAIWEEVGRLNREDGMTVFLTTHYLEEADRLADRVAIIDRGRIVAEGRPEELKAAIGTEVVTVEVSRERLPEARQILSSLPGLKEIQIEPSALTLYVDDGSGAVARIVRALDTGRISVGAIALSSPTLDDVFLRTTGSRLEGAEATPESTS